VPVQFEIDHAERFVNVRAYGVVRLAEILDYFDALSARLAPVVALTAPPTQQSPVVRMPTVRIMTAEMST
jgi:hypothetical protein